MQANKFARRNRPTPQQQAAYKRLLMPGGWKNVTVEDARHLATMKLLTASQRLHFWDMARKSEQTAQ